jgi:hypothetical protein
MDYELGKWLERVESKLDFIFEKIAEEVEKKEVKEEKNEEQVN